MTYKRTRISKCPDETATWSSAKQREHARGGATMTRAARTGTARENPLRTRQDVTWPTVAQRNATTRPAGFEPATAGLEIRCSILLSYGRHGLVSPIGRDCRGRRVQLPRAGTLLAAARERRLPAWGARRRARTAAPSCAVRSSLHAGSARRLRRRTARFVASHGRCGARPLHAGRGATALWQCRSPRRRRRVSRGTSPGPDRLAGRCGPNGRGARR